MDFAELNAILGGLGRAAVGPGRLPDGRVLAADPWRLIVPLDRGEYDEHPFRDEDDACRWLLARTLLAEPQPAPPGSAPAPLDADPDPVVLAAVRGRREPPRLRWRRPLPPFATLAARGFGLAVLTDASSLYRHGIRGCVHVAGIDIVSGRRLWSVPLWPPTRTPTVHVVGDVVLVWTDDAWMGLDAQTGERLWRTGPAPEVIAFDPGSGVCAVGGDGGGVMSGVDVRSGRVVWRSGLAAADPVYAYNGLPILSRVLCLRAKFGRVVVDAVRLADGSADRVADVAEPPGYRDAELLLIEDMADSYIHLRGRPNRRPGEVGTRLGDFVVIPGRTEALVIQHEPVNALETETSWLRAVDPGHFLLSDSGNALTARHRYADLSGRVLWRRNGYLQGIDRVAGSALVGIGEEVLAIDDSGAVRWQVPGRFGWLHDSVLWTAGAGYDAVTGEHLWSAADVELARNPNRIQGFRPDDGHLLFDRGDALEAFG